MGHVLVINCGSPSIKFSVIDPETSTHVTRGSIERLGEENAIGFGVCALVQ